MALEHHVQKLYEFDVALERHVQKLYELVWFWRVMSKSHMNSYGSEHHAQKNI